VNTSEPCPEGDDFDSPWKEAIREFFDPFMAFFFSRAHSEIDWARTPEFLDKELQQITHDAEVGSRIADVLVKVWLTSGEERWVAIHVEVQGQRRSDFTERMYVYNFRTYDRHRVRVASLAIITDESSASYLSKFEYDVFGCEVRFSFPVAILGEFRARRDELEQSNNPFSIFVLAHLETQDTKGDNEARFKAWRRLLKTIPKRGHSEEVINRLLRLIDWLLHLPKAYHQRMVIAANEAQEEFKMPFVSTFERMFREKAMAEGRVEGLSEGRVEGRVEGAVMFARSALLDLLTEVAGTVPPQLVERINTISDLSKLRILLRSAAHASSINDFETKLDNLN